MRKGWAAAVVLAGCAAGGPKPSFDPVPVSAVAAPEPEALRSLFGPECDRALAAVGLRRGDLRCTPGDLALTGVGRFPTPLYEALQAEPTLCDRYARTYREQALAIDTLEKASAFAAARLGVIVRPTLLGDPLAEEEKRAREPGALGELLSEVCFGTGFSPASIPADLPPAVAAAAALFLRVAWDNQFALKEGLPRLSMRLAVPEVSVLLADDEEGERSNVRRHEFEKRLEREDPHALASAAARVLLAADRAAMIASVAKDAPPFHWTIDTRMGTVVLRGGGHDTEPFRSGRDGTVLVIDTGGNDRYAAGGATAWEEAPVSSREEPAPVSVLIDLGGEDVYESDAPVAFGAGMFGVGAVLDLGGNDVYRAVNPKGIGLGSGLFGVGVLLDAAGNDRYEGFGLSQGAGVGGWGALVDLAGDDVYEAYAYSQGFGFVRGSGVLVDRAGTDTYTLNDTDIRFPSAQSKEHNSSLGQGFGFGLRADYLDGRSLAGGVGMLVDGAGDDRYSCGVFGQGGGYWMGVGMLLDGAGADDYRGVWYVQGASAHFAVGILEDVGGDDAYTASHNMAQGAGHDYGFGALLDRAGNDRYTAPNLSLGGGNACGLGLFADGGGDDVYRSQGLTLGLASVATPADAPSLRHGSLTLGLFLDLGGRDAFLDAAGTPHPFAGDGRLWTQAGRQGAAPRSNERGVGLDAGP